MYTKKIIIGYDHHFGRNREGNYEKLVQLSKLYSYEVEKIASNYMGVSVSSTKIRKKFMKINLKK